MFPTTAAATAAAGVAAGIGRGVGGEGVAGRRRPCRCDGHSLSTRRETDRQCTCDGLPTAARLSAAGGHSCSQESEAVRENTKILSVGHVQLEVKSRHSNALCNWFVVARACCRRSRFSLFVLVVVAQLVYRFNFVA